MRVKFRVSTLASTRSCKRYIKEKGEEGRMFSKISRLIFRKDEELENLAWLISVIDSYRVGMGVNIEELRNRIRTLKGPLKVENWTLVYNDMKAIVDLPLEKEPGIKLYINLFVFSRYLVKQSFLIVGVVLFIFLLTLRFPFSFTTERLQYLLYAIIAATWVVVAVRGITRNKLKTFYYHHMNDYRKNEERLQIAAQDLINKMGKALEEKGENPGKYTFSVYQKDYKGIQILSKPGVLRDFYTIAVKKR